MCTQLFSSCILIDNTKPSINNPIDYPGEGRDVVAINCSKVSNDVVTYAWYKKTDGGIYQKLSETGHTLNIGKSGSTGNADYKCEVTATNANISATSHPLSILFYCKFVILYFL